MLFYLRTLFTIENTGEDFPFLECIVVIKMSFDAWLSVYLVFSTKRGTNSLVHH